MKVYKLVLWLCLIFVASCSGNNNELEERIKIQAEKNTEKIEFTDKEKAIIDLLNEYIKPAVEADGGAITFNSYLGDVVTVNLKGACSGCPSATSTLKGGIESLLNQKVDPNIVVRANEG